MPGEKPQNEYYEKAKINKAINTTKNGMENGLLNLVDFKKVQSDLLKKIDAVAGVDKKQLNNKEYMKWRAAQEKVKEAVKKLRKFKQFLNDRWEVKNISENLKDGGYAPMVYDQIRKFGFSDVDNKVLANDSDIQVMVMANAFTFLTKFKDRSYDGVPAAMKLNSIRDAESAQKSLAKTMETYYKSTLPDAVKVIESKLNKKVAEKKMTLLEYRDLETDMSRVTYAVDSLEGLLKNSTNDILTSVLNGVCKKATDDVAFLQTTLFGTINDMTEPDSQAALDYNDALIDVQNKGGPVARAEYKRSVDNMNRIVLRQQVEKDESEAVAYGKNNPLFDEGKRKLKQAKLMDKNGESEQKVRDKYMEADKAFLAVVGKIEKEDTPSPLLLAKLKSSLQDGKESSKELDNWMLSQGNDKSKPTSDG